MIQLPPEALTPLKAWKAIQDEYRKIVDDTWPEESKDEIFTEADGKRMDLSSPTQKWRKIQKKYNLKDAPLYAYRHTGASLLIASGADVREVSGRLGHSRTSTTLDVYSHQFQSAAAHTTELLRDAIRKAKEESNRNSNDRL